MWIDRNKPRQLPNRHIDGKLRRSGPDDHDAAHESDSHGGTNGNIRSGREWRSTVDLPVAEEWRGHQRSDGSELHHARDFFV